MNEIPNTEFPITIYGNLEKYNEVLSKARCRIFYKYGNRNATYITDEFAEKLLSTIPYTPIKGIYDSYNEDYEDHGESRDFGKIYGVVPENPNLQWENHLDKDGVIRNYACVDVLIYTGLYKEASLITDKGLSMELYAPSLKGEWVNVEGQKFYVFTEGSFLGLQILGDDVEPCFEGAQFYNLIVSFKELVDEIKHYTTVFQKEKGGQKQMKMIFKSSDSEKFEPIWSLLNTEKDEEGQSYVEYVVTDIRDEYALAYNYTTSEYERIYYTKNEETNEFTLDSKETCYVFDLTEEENKVLEAIREKNQGTYENADQIFDKYSELEAERTSNLETIETLTKELNELKEEKEVYTSEMEAAKLEKEDLAKKVDALNEYKLSVETTQKEAILSEYVGKVSEDTLDALKEKLSEYTVLDLEKDLAYLYVQSDVSNFHASAPIRILKDESPLSGIESLLSQYKK